MMLQEEGTGHVSSSYKLYKKLAETVFSMFKELRVELKNSSCLMENWLNMNLVTESKSLSCSI